MAAKKPSAGRTSSAPSGTESVLAYLRELDHPLKPVLEAVRALTLGAHPEIREGIKWNAPSFWLGDWFATSGMQSKDFVRVVLHLGVKAKEIPPEELGISDPLGLLEWHAKDRCSAKFRDLGEVETNGAAFQDVVRQWLRSAALQ
ncbi:MAG TPA: DUF1801 domain-containing protein [Thermoanaerobaculia bacterium]|nr:DUF1801 domain-containing protein [Thermoanaerobaculia bacterium]